jgi:hypothetical protein
VPTVLLVNGYRFFFYSNEGHEPAHIHVEKGGELAKFSLEPSSTAWHQGFTQAQLKAIRKLIDTYRERFIEAWNDYFGT